MLKTGSRALAGDVRRTTPFPRRKAAISSLSKRMVHCATPGISVAVIDEGKLAWERGFGVRQWGAAAPVEVDTLFQAGSISKLVFALGVMRLVEKGLLGLDDDVHRYLTSWRVPSNGDWAPKITLRHLLSHSAGTTVHGFPGYPASGPWPTLSQILDGSPPANSDSVVVDMIPGLQFRYSGGGTMIAQAVVTDLLHRPLHEVVDELVFAPLQLTNSTFAQPLPKEWALRAATSHPWNAEPLPGSWRVYPEAAAAGLWTTAGDLARIGVEFLNALRGRGTRLSLSSESAAEMLKPQLREDAEANDYVGLAWWCARRSNTFHCFHTGWNEGFVSGLWLYPDCGKGAAVMINSNQGDALVDEVEEAIAREYRWPTPILESKELLFPIDIDGLYRSLRGNECRLSKTDEGLILSIDGQSPMAFTHAGVTLASDSTNATFEIAPSEGGQIAFVLTQSGRKFRFEKAS
jgi:CubicO group peptidase (beta-lactamase class C family)